MRWWILTAAIFVAIPIAAQHTTVTATVKDTNNSVYANCTGTANFTGQNTTPGAGPYLLGGTSGFQQVVPIFCDGSGNFTASLADNNLVTPTPSKWSFSLCSAPGYTGGPFCFSVLVTITGASQSITSALQAAAPLLPPSSILSILGFNNTWTGTGNIALQWWIDGVNGGGFACTDGSLPLFGDVDGDCISLGVVSTSPTNASSQHIEFHSRDAGGVTRHSDIFQDASGNPSVISDVGGLKLPVYSFSGLPTTVCGSSNCVVYCSDCNSSCTANGGSGRTCFRENGAWTH